MAYVRRTVRKIETPRPLRSSTPSAVLTSESTLNVGQHRIKLTGDSHELVRVAEMVLDDYFNSAEFLTDKACATLDSSFVSPISKPPTAVGASHSMMGMPLHATTPLTDSGIGLNRMATQVANNTHAGHDEVFKEANDGNQSNRLSPLRKNYFSRNIPENGINEGTSSDAVTSRIFHEGDLLMYHSNSPHSRAMPTNWNNICDKFPEIDWQYESNRFNGETHLELVKSATAPYIVAASDETDQNKE